MLLISEGIANIKEKEAFVLEEQILYSTGFN